MQIYINETPVTVPEQAALSEAITAFAAKPPFAAAVNGHFVAQQDYGHTALREGDKVDILAPIQGG